MLFYLITFILGLVLDTVRQNNKTTKRLRKLFVVWLYIFLCFGYMTGSDWRGYELNYQTIHLSQLYFTKELGFYTLFRLIRFVISDYWITAGLLKCIYLYTLLRIIKKLTPYWISVISLLLTGGLIFILINNPLRFMVALIFINVAVELILDKKYYISVLLIVLSFFFHNTCVFFLIIIPITMMAKRIASWNRWILVVAYMVVVYISSQAYILESIRSSLVGQLMLLSEEVKDYSTYIVDDNSSFFTIGNMVGIFFFFLVLYTRDTIVAKYEQGGFIFGMTVVYLFLARLLFTIPTGFRLNIPLEPFYMLYIVMLIKSKHILRWVFLAYFCLAFPRTLWNTYNYIPYSNSIPYILTDHKPYIERSNYNIIKYKERTGKDWEGQ